MITLKAKKRTETNLRILRDEKIIPVVLYGPKTESVKIQVDFGEFEKVHREAGDSLLVTLIVDDKEFLVLIRATQYAPVSGDPIHVDFYLPLLKEKVEVEVSVVLNGESLAVKNLGGTLVKNLSELPVKAFPQSLPKQININLDVLKTFDDKILVSDLKGLGDFEIMKNPNDIVVSISRPEAIMEDSEVESDEDVKKTEEVKKEEGKEEIKKEEGKEK